MSDAVERVAAFESASELRDGHARLLDALDHELGADGSASAEVAALARLEPQIRAFLERGAATGVYLEEVRERTACQVLLDYWVSSLAQAAMGAPSARLLAFDGAQLPDLKDKPCPYVGLEAFRGPEFFFGRDADTKELLEKIRDTPLVVVVGASGSGKSSLVMGGVLPALSDANAAPRLRIAPTIIPGNAALAHLADAVLQACGRGSESAAAAGAQLLADPGFLATMTGAGDAPPMLIAIDQFEEIFTLSGPAEREALVTGLVALLGAGRDHRVVLTMREEFRSRLMELRGLSSHLDKAWYYMRPMGYEALRAAVERPAAAVNLQYQAGIVDDLVKKVLGQPAALPLLQFTLRSLWDRRDRNRITWEVYRRVGDPLNALRTSADEFFDALAPQTQDEAKRILLELVRVDDLLEAYRQPVPKSRLLQAGKANTEEVLRRLAESDYVRVTADDVGQEAIIEVKHEALIRNWPRLVGWIDEKRIDRRQRIALTQAARRWTTSGRPAEGLLTGWQLEEAKRHPDLTEEEREFVQASAKEVDRAQHKREEALQREAAQARALVESERSLRRRTTAALVIVVVAALAIGVATFHFWRQTGILDERAGAQASEAKLQQEKADLLQYQAEVQRKQYDRLKVEYDQLFARQVRQAVAPASHLPSSQPLTIFLHISDAGQLARAEEIRKELEKNGIRVPGIERVATAVRSTQVRYFRDTDRVGADEIKRLLSEYLGVKEIDVEPIKGYEDKVRARQYEIWFARDALGPGPAGAAPVKR